MPDFYPALIAGNLQRQGIHARSASLPLHQLTERRDHSPLQLARLLDQPDAQAKITEMVVDVAAAGERVGLPAVLGLKDHSCLLKKIHLALVSRDSNSAQSKDGQGSSTAVFEIPTLPPSVPGLRLDAALRTQLAGLGVRVEIGMEVCRWAPHPVGRIRDRQPPVTAQRAQLSARHRRHPRRRHLR